MQNNNRSDEPPCMDEISCRGEHCEPILKKAKYIDKVNYYEGIITEVHDGSVAFDIKGRLGKIMIPKRMIISDYELKVGQVVAFNMSFIEQISS